jgi:hypothetical protein
MYSLKALNCITTAASAAAAFIQLLQRRIALETAASTAALMFLMVEGLVVSSQHVHVFASAQQLRSSTACRTFSTTAKSAVL